MPLRLWLAALAAAALLTACGQYGDLYLPPEEAEAPLETPAEEKEDNQKTSSPETP